LCDSIGILVNLRHTRLFSQTDSLTVGVSLSLLVLTAFSIYAREKMCQSFHSHPHTTLMECVFCEVMRCMYLLCMCIFMKLRIPEVKNLSEREKRRSLHNPLLVRNDLNFACYVLPCDYRLLSVVSSSLDSTGSNGVSNAVNKSAILLTRFSRTD